MPFFAVKLRTVGPAGDGRHTSAEDPVVVRASTAEQAAKVVAIRALRSGELDDTTEVDFLVAPMPDPEEWVVYQAGVTAHRRDASP